MDECDRYDFGVDGDGEPPRFILMEKHQGYNWTIGKDNHGQLWFSGIDGKDFYIIPEHLCRVYADLPFQALAGAMAQWLDAQVIKGRERLVTHPDGSIMFDDGKPGPLRPATNAEIDRIRGIKPEAPSGAGGNPKDGAAAVEGRVPLHLFPDTAVVAGAMAMVEGDAKYGGFNYRATRVAASVYASAEERHMKAWRNGEDIDPKSGLNHLWKALACIAILIDAVECDSLIDDRPPAAPVADMLERLQDEVRRIRAQHADKSPPRYTLRHPEGTRDG